MSFYEFVKEAILARTLKPALLELDDVIRAAAGKQQKIFQDIRHAPGGFGLGEKQIVERAKKVPGFADAKKTWEDNVNIFKKIQRKVPGKFEHPYYGTWGADFAAETPRMGVIRGSVM